jgi:hypothetical protein
MELLQEQVAEVLEQAKESKEHIVHTQADCVDLISEKITVQIVDTLKEKIVKA